jgi:D-alanyl-D-alanine carboxypeptidase/D-alanyl-D-alanine-endopeptidase (penicillin-binding protein 4)
MADTLKPSDNLYADSLYLHAASRLNHAPVNWPEAHAIIKHFLQEETHITLDEANLTDGSGLSRQDRLSANQTVELLRFLHTHFPLTYEYIAALPIAGQDGTLQKRLKKPSQKGFVRAKTGSMTGVTSLSGYLYTANAHTLAFAFYINTRPGTSPKISGQYRSLIDALCDYFLNQKPDNRNVANLDNAHQHVAFQQQPTQRDAQRIQQSRWRQIEHALKQALKNEPVRIIFRNEQLIIHDKNTNLSHVWKTLQAIHQKYAFSVALEGNAGPSGIPPSTLSLLWIKSRDSTNERTWTLHRPVDVYA